MSDHLDAPGLTSPGADHELDITDLYAFQKPDDQADQEGGKSILILNVNPLTLATEFENDAVYQLNVDTDGDALADRRFDITFSPKTSAGQTASVDLVVGSTRTTIVSGAPVSFGSNPIVTIRGPYKFFAGLRSDPFFFDLLGFLNSLQFTGSDFFLDKNVFGIVLEVPNKALGTNPTIGVWARTAKPLSAPVQVDRAGRPAINTVFNHGGDKNTFNSITPDQDRTTLNAEGVTFLQSFVSTLMTLGGYSEGAAMSIAEILLPDVLTYDFSSSAGFLNGRQLADDVIDIELGLVTNGGLKTDKVGPHTDYLSHFPYLGTPH